MTFLGPGCLGMPHVKQKSVRQNIEFVSEEIDTYCRTMYI